jgi:23S rRNA pseudouridine2605 synthase
MEKVRLQKYLAESAVASRRSSEELIKQGRVSINGETVSEMGFKVSDSDIIKVDGKLIKLNKKKIYIMLNKPKGIISSVKDQFARKTVLDLIKKDIEERIFPVGRLDYDTSGLLILSNDGDFTYRLTHPKHEIKKVYVAEVMGFIGEEHIEKFANGIDIGGFVTTPAKLEILEVSGYSTYIGITIHEGKNRQVRKMCDSIGHPVMKLKRVAIGKVELGDLKEGEWRYLSEDEISYLST